jgi:hypothetical protein
MDEHNDERWFWVIVITASTPWAVAGFYIVGALI